MPKNVSLKTNNTREIVATLTSGFTETVVNAESIDLKFLSEVGMALTEQETSILLQNIINCVDYGVLRGHINTGYANVSYGDERYFTYERLDKSVRSNSLSFKLNNFEAFRCYISDNNWIDIHFERADGCILTMVIVP